MYARNNLTFVELSDLITMPYLTPSLAAMLLCVALSAANQPDKITVIASKYLASIEDVDKKIRWVEYTRNGIMKSSILTGVARATNAQVALYNSLPKEYQSLLRTTPIINKNPDLWDSRGKDLLSLIYGDSLDTEINFLNNACSDQWHWIEQSYARILSDTTYLDSKHTELNIIVSLIQMNTPRQLRNHLDGAKRVGATENEIKAAEFVGYSVKKAFPI